MASLLSVLLVSSSSSGSRLLFAYPPNAVATPRVQRPLYGQTAAVREVQARAQVSTVPSSRNAYSISDDEDEDDDGEDMFGSRFIRGESSSSGSSEDEGDEEDGYVHDEYATREQREKETYKSHLGINTSVLGTLLCPSKDLCNKRFEMVINHLAFISHPVSKRTNHPPPPSRTERSSRKDAFETPFDSDGEEEELADGSLSAVEQNIRGRRPRNLRNSLTGRPASGFSSRRTSASMPSRPRAIHMSRESSTTRSASVAIPANLPLPSSSSSASEPPSSVGGAPTRRATKGSTFQPSPNQLHLVTPTADTPPGTGSASVSTSASFGTPGSTPTSQALPVTATSSKLPESDLDVWSVVLVIDSPPDQHLTSHLSVYYRDVIKPLMSGLKYQERRDQYVTKEAEKIALMREKAEESGMSLTPHVEEVCRESGLCAQLAAVYHGLKDSGMANLTFNDDIEMTVLLHHELFEQSRYNSSANASSNNRSFLGGSLRRKPPINAYGNQSLGLNRLDISQLKDGILEKSSIDIDILPWQTLLPLEDPDDMLKEVDDDDLFARFLEIMSPALTFSEYETLLDTDAQSIITIAEHLIYWRKAKLIDVISLKCIYVPSKPAPSRNIRLLAEWTGDFSMRFPELPVLPSLLAMLSNPQPFESNIASESHSRSLYMEALVWLLQKDLVTQLRVYMNLVATPEVKRAAYEREESKQKRHLSSEDGSNPEYDEEHVSGDGDSEQKDRLRPEDNAGHSGFSGNSSTSRSEKKNNSNITLSSTSSSRDATSSVELEATRSPLPASFPNNYPYISAASAFAAARPRKSGLHGSGKDKTSRTHRKETTSKARKVFLAALNAPSIIANPAEPSSEEELWIEEMRRQVTEEKGRDCIAAFDRMLPYLDGTHHLDEVRFRADISRKVIRNVLADFEGFLVTFLT